MRHRPLLQDMDRDDDMTFDSYRNVPKRHNLIFVTPVCLHMLLVTLYTCVYLLAIYHAAFGDDSQCPSTKNASHLPLPNPAGLTWEKRKFPTNILDNPYTGEPREELDEAWHRLLLNDNILVPRDFIEEKHLNTIFTNDGRYGVASLSVYHSLHCLKKVKRMLFREHYHQTKTGEAMTREWKHVDHCVEYIRESLMCQPDLSLVTFRWINNTAQHDDKSEFWPTNFDVDLHRCANWDALDQWAGKRVFNLFEVGKLQRPEPFST